MIIKIPTPSQEPSKDSFQKELEYHKDQPMELAIGSLLQGLQTRFKLYVLNSHWALLSYMESKKFKQAKKEESWIFTMQEELNQLKKMMFETLFHHNKTIPS